MEGKKTKPFALLVFGAPCSGKTTFAEKFANKFNIALYNFYEVKETFGFDRKNILSALELVARTKQNIVIEGGVDTEAERDEIRKAFNKLGYRVAVIWIQTDINTIRSRMKSKYKSISKAKNTYDALVNELEAPAPIERPIILSGKHTFETQTKHVIAGLADASRR